MVIPTTVPTDPESCVCFFSMEHFLFVMLLHSFMLLYSNYAVSPVLPSFRHFGIFPQTLEAVLSIVLRTP